MQIDRDNKLLVSALMTASTVRFCALACFIDGYSVVPRVLYYWYGNEGSLMSNEARATDERFGERIALLERKYRNLSQFGVSGVNAQVRLASEIVRFVTLRYLELGASALEQYRGEFRRARLAAEVPPGALESEIENLHFPRVPSRSPLTGKAGA